MANSNFVVHNGLTVGPLTIDAATGNITTTGYISGTVLGVSTNKISQDASNITASSNFVNVAVNGSNIAAFSTGGLNLTGNLTAAYVIGNGSQLTGLPAGYTNVQVATYLPIYSGTVGASLINSTGNILATGAVLNSLTVNGNQSVTGFINTSGNVSAAIHTGGAVSVTGFINTSGNVSAAVAKVGAVEATGMIYANSTAASTSTTTGALIVAGGIGVLKDSVFGGNLTVNGNVFINGNTIAINANNLTINDSMIFLAEDNPADTIDIGFVGHYSSPGLIHTGFVRDATDSTWKLFSNVTANPTTTVDFTNAIYSPLLSGTHTIASGFLNVSGNILATGGVLNSLTVNGNVTVTTAYVMPSANAASSLGTSAARWNFVYGVNGNFLSVNANYADLAEKYLADAEYVPGTVVDFGGTDEVTASTNDMSVRVAGVVSTQPGYVMNDGLEGENVVTLALTGRVPTRVTGSIRKGDMLVSNGDGRARAETLPRVGSVIGKAIEDFDGEDGVIEVVIGKH